MNRPTKRKDLRMDHTSAEHTQVYTLHHSCLEVAKLLFIFKCKCLMNLCTAVSLNQKGSTVPFNKAKCIRIRFIGQVGNKEFDSN